MIKNFSFILLFFSLNAFAQKASFNENSVSYLGKTYKVGDIIHLGYGSSNNKDFVFVNYGKSVGGVKLPGLYHHADVNWSKADVEIKELYTKNGVVWAKCDPKDRGSSVGSFLGNKVYINIEGAVDNNEIRGLDAGQNTNQKQNSVASASTTNTETAAAPTPDTKSKSSKTSKNKTIQPVKRKTSTN